MILAEVSLACRGSLLEAELEMDVACVTTISPEIERDFPTYLYTPQAS
jgi:hypothetical protein